MRQCAPYELRADFAASLGRTLRGCASVMRDAYAALPPSPVAAAHLASLVDLFSSALLPHMGLALDRLVPPHAAATAEAAAPHDDGAAERMVAAVRAELQPLLAPSEPPPAAPPAAAVETGGEAAKPAA